MRVRHWKDNLRRWSEYLQLISSYMWSFFIRLLSLEQHMFWGGGSSPWFSLNFIVVSPVSQSLVRELLDISKFAISRASALISSSPEVALKTLPRRCCPFLWKPWSRCRGAGVGRAGEVLGSNDGCGWLKIRVLFPRRNRTVEEEKHFLPFSKFSHLLWKLGPAKQMDPCERPISVAEEYVLSDLL